MCSVSRTLKRLEVVDLTESTHLDEITFVSQWPSSPPKDIILALPLERSVWLLIFIYFVAISFLLYYLGAILNYPKNFNQLKNCHTNLSLTFLNLFAIYLSKSIGFWRIVGDSNFHRIVYCFWTLGAMVLSIGYSGRLYSILTLSRSEPLDSAQQLLEAANHDTHNIIVKKNTALWSLIFVATKEENYLYYSVAEHIKRFVFVDYQIVIICSIF